MSAAQLGKLMTGTALALEVGITLIYHPYNYGETNV
jgi:hypothetical protein